MSGSILDAGLYIFAAVILGVLIGWLIRSRKSSASLDHLGSEWQTRFDHAVRQKDKMTAEAGSLRKSLEAEQALLKKHIDAAQKGRTELESLREKANSLSKDLFTVGAERDELSDKVSRHIGLFTQAKQRIEELHTENAKVGEFYKAQIETSQEQRQVLERQIEHSKSENESLRNLLMSTKAEHESVSNMLASAKSRLQELETLEQKVISLEADNAELKHEAILLTREIDSLQRDAAEIETLKEQNRELAHCLESMESSRKQYEQDARRYRSQYEKSEHESETLRFKLGDIEKNLAELHHVQKENRQANDAGNHATNNAVPPFGLVEPQGEMDDLTEIVGIGKVFEETLHRLGVYHFRQIAAFGPAELARVNAELKEFRGRIEHDDWVGQAKELHFKKYGAAAE